MITEIQRGSVHNIQDLDCWIAEPGWVVDRNGQLKQVDIYKRSEIESEQYWERLWLPSWYNQRIKEEKAYNKKKKDEDPPFYDALYEIFKAQEWDRRLNGFWFMNNGVATYITGAHYMYLQWWHIDIGYPKFRVPDQEYFYFLEYCIEDPLCLGMLEITKRRFGKTFRGGLFVTDYVTRTKMANGGIQSKTGLDAKKVFAKAIISPFKKLPPFFRPEYDTAGGVTPKTEILFQQTNVKGRKAEDLLDKDELESRIDHQSADPLAYDGQKLHRVFEDEWAKTIECDIYDRHEVIRYCLVDDENNVIGKALYSSTVEKLDTDKDGVQEGAKKLWDDSDQASRGENGRTASGLYRFFMSAKRARNFDKYGFPDEEKTLREILADRATVEHNQKSLSARKRKEPLTIEEAFNYSNDDCVFNLEKIVDREAELKKGPIYKRKVIFERGEDGLVGWRNIRKGEEEFHWKTTYLLDPKESNKFEYKYGIRVPGRIHDGAITVDGYSNSQGGKKYGSKASAWIGRRYSILDPQNTGKPVALLYGRPTEKGKLHEQVMLAAEYFGYKVWYEHNADDYDSYYRERGKQGYLGVYPLSTIDPNKRQKAERHRGFPTTPVSLTRQLDVGIAFFNHFCHLIDFEELLADAKKFDPAKRTAFDMTVSFLMLLVCLIEPVPIEIELDEPFVNFYVNENYQGAKDQLDF
jgi:hypothetical protein